MAGSSEARSVHSVNFIIGTTTKNTYDDWLLIPTERPVVVPPQVKTNYVDLPGADGDLDLTETVTSVPVYKPREGAFEFYMKSTELSQPWFTMYSSVLNFLHGKSGKMILDDDPDWYYSGRFEIDTYESKEHWAVVSVKYHVQPKKTNVSNEQQKSL